MGHRDSTLVSDATEGPLPDWALRDRTIQKRKKERSMRDRREYKVHTGITPCTMSAKIPMR